MNRINYIRQDGVVNGIDFDGRFRVKRWPAVAVVAMGYFAEYPESTEDDPEPELVSDESRIVVVMVGDDKRHIVAASDLIREGLTPMSEETVFKPLSDIEAAILQATPADMLLLMVALDRKEKFDKLALQYDNSSESNS
jgi:hypothetical protein